MQYCTQFFEAPEGCEIFQVAKASRPDKADHLTSLRFSLISIITLVLSSRSSGSGHDGQYSDNRCVDARDKLLSYLEYKNNRRITMSA